MMKINRSVTDRAEPADVVIIDYLVGVMSQFGALPTTIQIQIEMKSFTVTLATVRPEVC